MKALLTRQLSTDEGTFGKLEIEGGFSCVTLELPWRNDTSNISCVPIGNYHVAMAWSPKHQKMVYHLQDENGRKAVEIHSANLAGDVNKGYVAELEGCIAPGKEIAVFKAGINPAGFKDQRGITSSAAMQQALEEFTQGKDFDLEIVYDAGVQEA